MCPCLKTGRSSALTLSGVPLYARAEDRIVAHKILNRINPDPVILAFDAGYLLFAMSCRTPEAITDVLGIDIHEGI
jgi:hypothetical protein